MQLKNRTYRYTFRNSISAWIIIDALQVLRNNKRNRLTADVLFKSVNGNDEPGIP